MYRRVRSNKRRSLGGSTTPSALSQSYDSLGENDDASERRKAKRRRRSSMGGRRSSSARRSSSVGSNRRLSLALGWGAGSTDALRQKTEKSASDLNSLYQETMKLASKNRITEKNAWGLQLLDYVKEINAVDNKTTDFLKAGTVLDMGTQIYSKRLDSIYKSSLRIQENLNKTKDEAKPSFESKEALAKKRRANKETLGNDNMLNTHLPSLIRNEDPMFTKMSQMFDAGGVGGLLLANLKKEDNSIVFCSSQSLDVFSQAPGEVVVDDAEVLKEVLKKVKVPKKGPGVATKLIMEEMMANCDDDLFAEPADEHVIEDDFQIDDCDFEHMPSQVDDLPGEQSELLQDENLFEPPAGMFDFACPMPADFDNVEPDERTEGTENAKMREQVAEMDQMTTFFSHTQTYSQVWTGAQAWTKHMRIRAMRESVNEEKAIAGPEKKKRRKRKINFFDFSASKDKVWDERIWRNGHPNQYQIRAEELQKLKKDSKLLPKDFRLTEDIFFTPFLLPRRIYNSRGEKTTFIDDEKSTIEQDHFDDVPGFSFDDDFPPEPLPEDPEGADGPGKEVDLELQAPQSQGVMESISVPFERTSSAVNVRRMKRMLYKCYKKLETAEESKISFQKVVSEFVQEKARSKSQSLKEEEHTPHLLFVALLYLCNEKGMKLEGKIDSITIQEVGLGPDV